MQGFRALVPYERVRSYRHVVKIGRPGSAGKAGVFSQLLQRHPELEALIVSELRVHRVVVTEGSTGLILSGLSGLHRRFRQLCLELGLTERDYPLVQKQQGI
jgi:putative transposase